MPIRTFPAVCASLVLASILSAASPATAADTPVRKRLPPDADAAIATLLAWQSGIDGHSEAQVLQSLGPPDRRSEMPNNEISGDPMHALKYRLSRRSELSVVVHQGKVAAVTLVLVPSANESGPVDD